ncbi:hypothetical protein ARMGADRAFT_1032707 [Armillaria gallica]|uniref:Uncharacterized protein n=1 Tax=Armillaria gallica TaxID=47427 RepID=A0A2H3D4D5_ARMGA|nr:hypothetical protein ARMGADRAFT_1032707 [Armillaria gallica]
MLVSSVTCMGVVLPPKEVLPPLPLLNVYSPFIIPPSHPHLPPSLHIPASSSFVQSPALLSPTPLLGAVTLPTSSAAATATVVVLQVIGIIVTDIHLIRSYLQMDPDYQSCTTSMGIDVSGVFVLIIEDGDDVGHCLRGRDEAASCEGLAMAMPTKESVGKEGMMEERYRKDAAQPLDHRAVTQSGGIK